MAFQSVSVMFRPDVCLTIYTIKQEPYNNQV